MLQYWLHLSQANAIKAPSYGRASKVVVIYLKTSVGMQAPTSHSMQQWLHPPIDRVLLGNLRKELGFTIKTLPNWTQLDSNGYAAVLADLTQWMKMNRPGRALWEVEEFWEVK